MNTENTIRILSLTASVCYIIIILFTWISANLELNMYFTAGEPVLSSKYPEWILGFTGIIVAADYLQMN